MTRRCHRCGVDREVNESRARRGEDQGLCRDCITVERDVAALEDWHGTYAGYYRHVRAREIACAPCLAAKRNYNHDHTPKAPRRRVAVHGSESGYQAHRRRYNGWPLEACDECRLAHNAHCRRIKAAIRARRKDGAA